MPEPRSGGAAFECDATVEEIKDNMKSILGKVNSIGIEEKSDINLGKGELY